PQEAAYLTASRSALPALKPGTFAALILIAAPVCGLRPVRAARLRTEKVPKPTSVTCSPFFRALVTALIMPSTARAAAALEISAALATASISSDLFIIIIPFGVGSIPDSQQNRLSTRPALQNVRFYTKGPEPRQQPSTHFLNARATGFLSWHRRRSFLRRIGPRSPAAA